MRKQLSIFILLLLVFSLCACTPGGGPSAGQSTGGNAEAFDKNSVTTDDNGYELRGYTLPISETPLTLTLFMETDVKWSATRQTVAELSSYRIISEMTGIDIKFDHPPAGQGTEQLNLYMASNSLPDMIFYNWRAITGGPAKYIAENQILKLNDYLDLYAPNYMHLLEKYPKIARDAVLDDGSHYQFQMLRINDKTGGWYFLNGFTIRQDWLEKLNLETPSNLDELEQVLIGFRDGDPNGNGIADEIPLTFEKNADTSYNVLAANFGVLYGMCKNGDTVVYGPIEDNYKDYLKLMHRWYSEGLLDEEFLLNDGTAVTNKMTSGQAGLTYALLAGGLGTYTNMLAELDPEAKIAPISYFPSETDGKTYLPYSALDSVTGTGTAISVNCKHIKEAVMFRDFFYSEQGILISNFGEEGESYTFVDGKPTFTANVLSNDRGLTTTQALSYYVLSASNDAMVKSSDYFDQISLLLDNQKESQDVWGKNADYSLVYPGGASRTIEESTEYAEIFTPIKSYVDETTAKFIMGQLDIDAQWDAYVANVKAMNVEKLIKIDQDAYNRYLQR
ncbi:MAG: extracellular solute-binding protein [Christensenellales bacterium]|jgi:putative aldouronate transport system substrate-binding protein